MPWLTKAKAADDLAISLTSLDELITQGRIRVSRVTITPSKPKKNGQPRRARPAVRIDTSELARFKQSCVAPVKPKSMSRRRPTKPTGLRLVKEYV